MMIDLSRAPARSKGPYYLTSVNGEVLARRFFDKSFAEMIDCADSIAADGQPLVVASKIFSQAPLPERVATTDLYPIVARMAQETGASFYLFGASEEVNRATYENTLGVAPRLNIVGRSHGYLKGAALDAKIEEINTLAPDILWLAMGVPLEQQFVRDYAHRLKNVKMIKTSGGLFDFIAGTKKRAPQWMQDTGLEWAFRLSLEPKRLLKRYLTTNPVAAFLLLTQTQ
ncbi:WecB/TagA/CpsF family glycosyltransferase [Methylocystis parvus]|uniref:WecB/TagA/CpsF family glycosyltransferase n=2 Tax=Methylocystis parvus TaxID=134 RepID=A0A6B8MCI4_9HYPH|nr:WecB/TagA/CpsF family glycosyltransferase [Methylocystis parvus]